jgi:hypothetical protein
MKKKLNKTELDRFLKTIAQRLEVVFGWRFTLRICENLLCKAFRVLSNKAEAKWCDTICPLQFLFVFKSGSIEIIHPTSEREVLEGDAVINRFPFGNQLMSMKEIVAELGLSNTLPSDIKMLRYQFSRKVWSPKVIFEVEYALPRIKPLSVEGEESSRSILTNWIGGRPIPRKRRYVDL